METEMNDLMNRMFDDGYDSAVNAVREDMLNGYSFYYAVETCADTFGVNREKLEYECVLAGVVA
jgi:hypothetical protein